MPKSCINCEYFWQFVEGEYCVVEPGAPVAVRKDRPGCRMWVRDSMLMSPHELKVEVNPGVTPCSHAWETLPDGTKVCFECDERRAPGVVDEAR